MKSLPTKPAIIAGFSLLLGSALVSGQDYIDVEAEREAARRGKPVEVITGTGTGDSSVPTVVSTDDRSSYSVPGIRPYSGQTVTAVPVTTVGAVAATEPVNVGSLVVQLQQLQEEVRRLNGMVEEQAQQIQRLKEQSLERYVDLDRRLAASGGVGPIATPNTGMASSGEALSAPPAGAKPNARPAEPGEEPAYQSAYSLVKARKFDGAVDAFKGFLTDYPFGRYAPNAHYWLGELYLVLDNPDPELARQSFKLLLDQYPDNPKVPDALYKLGRVHFLKGNRDRSREYLRRVISEYPGHPAAQLAQDFISDNF